MSDNNWQDVSEEVLEKDGEIVSRRTTRQVKYASTTVLGLNKERIELILKLAGLLTAIIAVFNYLGTIKERQREEVRQHSSDSTSNAHWQAEEIAQQSHAAANELNAKRELGARHEELEKRLANSFALIYAQKQVDIDKEKRDYYLTTLTGASVQMQILLDKPLSSKDHNNANDELFLRIYPRIGNIGDSAILKAFLDFRALTQAEEATEVANTTTDTIMGLMTEVQAYLKKDSINVRHSIANGKSDSFQYLNSAVLNLHELIKKQEQASLELQAVYTHNSKMFDREVFEYFEHLDRFHGSCSDFYISLMNLARKHEGTPSIDMANATLAQLTLGIYPRFDMYRYASIPRDIEKSLHDKKEDFDALIHRKMTFYQDPIRMGGSTFRRIR